MKGKEKMELNIMLLNAMQYPDKENNNVVTSLITYIFTDKDTKSNNENFKGYGIQNIKRVGDTAFKAIPYEWLGQKVLAHCEERNYPDRPLVSRKVITKLELNGKVVDLL